MRQQGTQLADQILDSQHFFLEYAIVGLVMHGPTPNQCSYTVIQLTFGKKIYQVIMKNDTDEKILYEAMIFF